LGFVEMTHQKKYKTLSKSQEDQFTDLS